eukprot:TRINITY_DN1247_c0_g1_i1.p1 TRINITY_DN1247_c0_g1~~TRINITY_DN1247_c0_g1_i1.p1  ORF type:complete len:260 (+),score=58.16 TRINITY_DN1247_c0_g1_i1:206-985(+)
MRHLPLHEADLTAPVALSSKRGGVASFEPSPALFTSFKGLKRSKSFGGLKDLAAKAKGLASTTGGKGGDGEDDDDQIDVVKAFGLVLPPKGTGLPADAAPTQDGMPREELAGAALRWARHELLDTARARQSAAFARKQATEAHDLAQKAAVQVGYLMDSPCLRGTWHGPLQANLVTSCVISPIAVFASAETVSNLNLSHGRAGYDGRSSYDDSSCGRISSVVDSSAAAAGKKPYVSEEDGRILSARQKQLQNRLRSDFL